MTDKERMQKVLESCSDRASLEEIIFRYLNEYDSTVPASRLNKFIDDLTRGFLQPQIEELESVKSVARERAFFLKTYLSGEMWPNEEEAKRNLQPQIDNAQTILDFCNGKYSDLD